MTWLLVTLIGLALWNACSLHNLHTRIKTMPTEAEFDAKLVELKQAIADAAQRVIDKIAELIRNNPDLTDELADVQDDIEKLKLIAPVEVPPAP